MRSLFFQLQFSNNSIEARPGVDPVRPLYGRVFQNLAQGYLNLSYLEVPHQSGHDKSSTKGSGSTSIPPAFIALMFADAAQILHGIL